MENEDRDDLPIIPENCLEQDYNSQINISDVIEVIQTTDPVTATAMFNNGGELHQPQSQQQQQQQQAQQQQQQQQQQLQQPQPPIPSQNGPSFNNSPKHNAYVEITEQPAPKAIRFRYECEGRSAGSIPGVNFTADNKTFPSIKVVGYKGRAVVVVSCVTKDPPYRPHPHRLVGKEGCKKGVCTVEINSETMSVTFSNLGIQCVKRKDIEGALLLREEIRVDPYRTGFPHRDQPSTIDLNAVRLCFQVFLESDNRPRFSIPLAPVVSDPIYDKKGTNDLTICKLSDCSSSCAGGKEIILLCEKVAKEDIKVRFFERKDGIVVWDAYGDFNHTNVHKQVAISFKVPRYKSLDITQTVKVFIQLKRPSDDVVSEALPFDYLPLDAGLGRHSFLSIRRTLDKGNMDIFQRILADDNAMFGTTTKDNCNQLNNNININNNQCDIQTILNEKKGDINNDIIILDTPTEEKSLIQIVPIPEQIQLVTSTDEVFQMNTLDDKTNDWLTSNEFDDINDNQTMNNNNDDFNNDINTTSTINETTINEIQNNNNNHHHNILKHENSTDDDKTLTELLEQVAELDEIYSDHQLRRDNNNYFIENELKILESSMPKTPNDENHMDIDELFDDAATYSSLQKAFKNPIEMMDMNPSPPEVFLNGFNENNYTYDIVEPPLMIINPPAPIIDVSPLKRENRDDEKLPPLPPKRIKKIPGSPENNENQPTNTIINNNNNQRTIIDKTDENTFANSRRSSTRSVTPRPQSQIITIMKTPDSPPTKKLPPRPNNNQNQNNQFNSNTLPKQKKPGFFSKLFSRKKSKSDINSSANPSVKTTPNTSREASVINLPTTEITGRGGSITSYKSLQNKKHNNVIGKPVGRSVSSVSGKRPHLTAEIVHIPLKGDSTNSLPQRGNGSGTHLSLPGNDDTLSSYDKTNTIVLNPNDRRTVSALQLADLPLQDGNMELIAIADAKSLKNLCEGQYGVQLDPSVDLTEAEHYALYTSVPPHATVSEFDENSCYYAPVEAGEILTPAQVAKRLTNNL